MSVEIYQQYIHDLYISWNIIKKLWLLHYNPRHTFNEKAWSLSVFKNNWLDFCWLSSGWSWSPYEQWAYTSFDEWPGTMFMYYISLLSLPESHSYTVRTFNDDNVHGNHFPSCVEMQFLEIIVWIAVLYEMWLNLHMCIIAKNDLL